MCLFWLKILKSIQKNLLLTRIVNKNNTGLLVFLKVQVLTFKTNNIKGWLDIVVNPIDFQDV